jgi:X-Pro dipeptidyl-peptidase
MGGTRLAAAAVTLLCSLAAAAPALGAAPKIAVEDGVTQPVFGYADAIRERVWVEADFDSDSNGENDRIALDVMRPRETEDGLRVPVVMDASPYYTTVGRGNESERKEDVDGDGLLDKWPLFYDNYFVPRGYAMVLLDMVGTGSSTGCPVTGGREDNLSAKVAIDWLNGRATARDADDNVVEADWHNGRTGMIGKSYDGTLANAAAATGVDGLTTIVPISAISSWYDYTRSNGLITRGNSYPSGLANTVTNPERRGHCLPVRDWLAANDGDETGDYTEFWAERDFNPHVSNVRSSVFVIHGINDNNVKPDHFSKWWYGLQENDVPRKLWLTQTGHVDPFDFRREHWVDTIHRWFDYWLQGYPNGIMSEPELDIERGIGDWETERRWPAPRSGKTNVWLLPGAPDGSGELGLKPARGPAQTRSFVDEDARFQNDQVSDEETVKPYRLAFLSRPLKSELRFSGTPVVQLHASADKDDTNLGAILVDYGPVTRVGYAEGRDGIIDLETEDCWGESSDHDDPCYRQTVERVASVPQEVVTKGVLDALNRNSLTAAEPLVPGQSYELSFPLLPEDYVFEAGHRVGVVIVGSYRSYAAARQGNGARITLSTKQSRVTLPIVGGHEAAIAAGL